MTPSEVFAGVLEADKRIRPHALETPLRYSRYLSAQTGANVYLKLENLQETGSFKARGAANKIASLTAEARTRGVVTASSGNHGAAVAAMLAKAGGRCLVFAPENAPVTKIAAIRSYGSEVRQRGSDSGLCETEAIAYAAQHGLTYISPYDDPAVIAGQGTIGAEIERQLPNADAVVVSVGGGGLISGIAGYLKARNPSIRVIGASPENDHSMALSVKAGRAVVHQDYRPTISDGTAGSVQDGAITVDLCKALVDDWPLVAESAIMAALRDFISQEYLLAEGAAGVALASFLSMSAADPQAFGGKNVVIVICGARIDLDKLAEVLAQR